MKHLEDLSVFTCRKAKLLYADPPSMISNAGRHRSIRECVCCHPPLLKQPLYCRYVSRSVLDDYFFQRRLRQKFLSLEYVFEGSIHVRSGEEAWLLEAGDLLLMHPGRRSGLLHLPGSTCRKSGMILGGGRLEETLRLLNLENARCLHFPDSGRMENFIARLCRALRAVRAPGGCERVSGIVFELLSVIANSDASIGLVMGGFVALVFTFVYYMLRNVLRRIYRYRIAAVNAGALKGAKMDEKAKVEGRLTEARAAIARWQERARAAAARGMDDLAREAIAARRELERKADKDEQLSTTLADVIASLQATLERTEKKLEELLDKSDSLKARADGAKVRAKAEKAEGTDWERKIAEMEERIRRWEAMADMDSHRPDRSFEDMERDEEIEKELERLKKEASHGTSDRVL